MTKQESVAKIQQAQKLLAEVYHDACDSGNRVLESLMSAADTCICEAIDYLED